LGLPYQFYMGRWGRGGGTELEPLLPAGGGLEVERAADDRFQKRRQRVASAVV
jgi:hypothetical protein